MTSERKEEAISKLDFTQRALETFYDAVDDPYFRDRDLEVIFEALKDKMQMISFGDFLKRYIYQKAGMNGEYREIPVSEYQEIICCEFRDRQTPASFTSPTVRIKNVAKNWLEQKSVSRSAILLLGFGLGMSAEDVNSFLEKAVKEQNLNAKDPFEVICWFCYKNGYGYRKFEQLWKDYTTSVPKTEQNAGLLLDETSVFKMRMLAITDEGQLMNYLGHLPIAPGTTRQSVMARKQFDRIYGEVCEWVANELTAMEISNSGVMTERMKDQLDRNDRKYDFEKREMLENARNDYHRYSREEISPADVEQVLFASVPKDRNGNLLPMKSSVLSSQFAGARLSRQHLSDILSGKAPITRYDLITLNFLAFEQKTDEYGLAQRRYSAFIDSTNKILGKCDMGPMYPVNPYENFLMMCMLTVDPVGTFSDVWELSYTEA